ncbi:hypothetical protein [Oceanobacillus massiliensis]|uniref:hypothetical protein n=1 Tax=Oceanobacillus massiliensis TaxID=1465765 RepID=UPI003019FC94
MRILVADCNHWVGYNIVNSLLENDYEVDGISLPSEDDLSMFFGRNSLFSLIAAEEYKEYELGIIAGAYHHPIQQRVEKLMMINPDEKTVQSANHPNCTVISTPLLYGEWMPMNEKGLFQKDEFISFTADYFKENAIYVRDLTEGLLQWIKGPSLPDFLQVYSSNNKRSLGTKLDKTVYLRENIPNSDIIKEIVEHYRLNRNRDS